MSWSIDRVPMAAGIAAAAALLCRMDRAVLF